MTARGRPEAVMLVARREHMNRVCAVFCVFFISGCEDVVVIASDAGVVVDGGFDGGFDVDAGIVVDAGVDAGVKDCVIDEVEEFPFVANGTEDLIDPRGDAPYPDVDVLAMWSRMEGDTWVVEVQFAAPPFRRNLGLDLAWGLDRRPELDLGQVLRLCTESPCEELGVDMPVSGVVNVSAAFGPFPPDQVGSSMRDHAPVAIQPVCSHVFVTPSEPYLKVRFSPDVAPSVTWPAPYHWMSNNIYELADRIDVVRDHSWSSIEDPFFTSNGGAATPTESFVSVCDLTCEDLRGNP